MSGSYHSGGLDPTIHPDSSECSKENAPIVGRHLTQKWFTTYEYVLDRDSVSIFSVLAECDVFLVDYELSVVSCENNQQVSSSKLIGSPSSKCKKAKEKQGDLSSVKGEL